MPEMRDRLVKQVWRIERGGPCTLTLHHLPKKSFNNNLLALVRNRVGKKLLVVARLLLVLVLPVRFRWVSCREG